MGTVASMTVRVLADKLQYDKTMDGVARKFTNVTAMQRKALSSLDRQLGLTAQKHVFLARQVDAVMGRQRRYIGVIKDTRREQVAMLRQTQMITSSIRMQKNELGQLTDALKIWNTQASKRPPSRFGRVASGAIKGARTAGLAAGTGAAAFYGAERAKSAAGRLLGGEGFGDLSFWEQQGYLGDLVGLGGPPTSGSVNKKYFGGRGAVRPSNYGALRTDTTPSFQERQAFRRRQNTRLTEQAFEAQSTPLDFDQQGFEALAGRRIYDRFGGSLGSQLGGQVSSRVGAAGSKLLGGLRSKIPSFAYARDKTQQFLGSDLGGFALGRLGGLGLGGTAAGLGTLGRAAAPFLPRPAPFTPLGGGQILEAGSAAGVQALKGTRGREKDSQNFDKIKDFTRDSATVLGDMFDWFKDNASEVIGLP